MSFVTIPGLVSAETTESTPDAAQVSIPSTDVPDGATVHDVIIVGSGPAGYTAAVYTARAGLSPLVLAGQLAAGGALMNTTEVENFPGFPEGILGPELMDNMRAQAEKFGAHVRYEDVLAVNLEGPVKAVATEDQVFYARAVILATGSEYRHMDVPGEQEFSGRGVSYCATCDGFFFKDRRLAVIGGGDSAMEEATFRVRRSTPSRRTARIPHDGRARAEQPKDLLRVERDRQRGPGRPGRHRVAPGLHRRRIDPRHRRGRRIRGDRPPAPHGIPGRPGRPGRGRVYHGRRAVDSHVGRGRVRVR